MKLNCYNDPNVFNTLASEWNPLLRQAASNVIFLTREWQMTWWHHMTPGELLVLTFQNEDQLCAIVPLFRRKADDGAQILSIVGCKDISDYLDFIVKPDAEEAVCTEVLRFLMSNEAPTWDRLELCNLTESSTIYRILPRYVESLPLDMRQHVDAVCPVIELPGTWEAYLGSLDKKQRHEIRRKMRRASATTQTSWYVVDPTIHDLNREMESFFELHRLSSPEKNLFMDDRMRGFFVDMAQSIARHGWLHLSFLVMNGEKAAGMLCFEYNHKFEVYNSGYNPNAYAHLSPGIVLLSYCIQYAIGRHYQKFDFLRGDEEYKFRFGAKPIPVYELQITRNGSGPRP